jgi:hypothetical protein
MKLDQITPQNTVSKILKESFGKTIDENLPYSKAKSLLNRFNEVIEEARANGSHNTKGYLEAVIAKQALEERIANFGEVSIITESEETIVEKSQIILACKDIVERIQKMVETCGLIQVKELPALVDSISAKIGQNESTEYMNVASEALATLIAGLQQGMQSFKEGLRIVTGEQIEMGDPFAANGEIGGDAVDLPDGLGAEDEELGQDADIAPDNDVIPGAGRAKR